MSTSSSFLNRVLSSIKGYKGAFPRDNIPILKMSIKEKKYVIINTDKTSDFGEHWVCLCFHNNICIYFDTFGLSILENDIKKYVKNMGYNRYVYNYKAIQPFYSELCGYYVIAFILATHCGQTFDSFINQFEKIENNDAILINILNYYANL